MKLFSAATFLGAALAAASCTVAPVKITEGEQCFRSRRTIVDARMAGEIVQGSLPMKFRTSGCMAKYLVDHPDEAGTIFVTDYATGKLVSPDKALFVSVIVEPRTNERDYRAYSSLADAESAAVAAESTAIGWRQVLANTKS